MGIAMEGSHFDLEEREDDEENGSTTPVRSLVLFCLCTCLRNLLQNTHLRKRFVSYHCWHGRREGIVQS